MPEEKKIITTDDIFKIKSLYEQNQSSHRNQQNIRRLELN